MKQRYVTLEDFLRISGIKKSTFLKRYENIPGVERINEEFKIIEGTRLPYNLRRNKLKTTDDQRYVLLKAINENKYIDSNLLRTHPKEFENLLRDLLRIGFIERNGINNPYGANGYRTTIKGGDHLKKTKRETIRYISTLLAECAGKFAKQFIPLK